MKGYDEPLTTNVLDALGVSVKESAGIATALALVGIYFFRWLWLLDIYIYTILLMQKAPFI